MTTSMTIITKSPNKKQKASTSINYISLSKILGIYSISLSIYII